MLLLIALFVMSAQSFARLDDAMRWNVHTYRVLGEIDGMTESLLSATRAARRYSVSGDDAFRAESQRAQTDFDLYRNRAARLTRDNPTQQQSLQTLTSRVARWRRDLIAPMIETGRKTSVASNSGISRQAKGTSATQAESTSAAQAESIDAMRQGALTAWREASFDGPRATLQSMKIEEQRLLSRRESEGRMRQQATQSTLAFGVAFVLLLACLLFAVLARGTRQLARVNERLEIEIEERARIEARLRERQGFLSGLLDNLNAGVVACDARGMLTMFNSTARERHLLPSSVAGSGEHASEHRLLERDGETPMPVEATPLLRALGGETVRALEFVIKSETGEKRILSSNAQAIRDAAGEISGAVSISQDMTAYYQAQQALKDSEERHRQLFDRASDLIYSTDAAGHLVFFNPTATRLMNCAPERLRGMHYLDLVLPEHRHAAARFYGRQFARRIADTYYEFPALTPDGTIIWFGQNVHLMIEDGRVVGFQAVARDITDRRLAEEELSDSQERFRRLSEGAFEALSIARDGVIVEANGKFSELFGYAPDAVIGMNVADFAAPESRALVRRNVENNSEEPYEAMGKRRDGSYFPVELCGKIIPYHGQPARITAIRDITQRREIETMKNEFISTVSHELRTPLTSIRGSLGLLVGGVAGELPPRARGMIDIAHKNSERLVRLINDILDIEKIESGKMVLNLETQALKPLIETTIEANRGFGETLGVSFELQIPDELQAVQIDADSDRLMQVLTNLLSNAAKFSPRGAAVQVRIAPSPEALGDASAVRVEVSDQGPGVPAEFRDRIFGKFAQADSSDTRQKGGTGLGLSISKAIIEKLGGRIGFWSHPEQGTTFFFDLPRHQAEVAAHMSTHVEEKVEIRPRILVCEDDRDVAALLEMMLHAGGFDVDVAHETQVARALLRQARYDGMTLDIMLPDQDGISFLRELRESDPTRDLPIVVVSAQAQGDRLGINGDALGVSDWLEKPINATRLEAAVRRSTSGAQGAGGARPRVLHVEDDLDVVQVVRDILQDCADVAYASTVPQAREQLERNRFDLVVLDMELPGGTGTEILSYLAHHAPHVPVVIFSASDANGAARNIAATLVKSRTSNNQFLSTIKALLHRETPHRETPHRETPHRETPPSESASNANEVASGSLFRTAALPASEAATDEVVGR